MMIKVRGLRFSYAGGEALRGISFKIERGEVVGLIGPNGSGKTTLLKCLNRILSFKVGSVYLDGKEIGKMGLREVAKLIGYVPQGAPQTFPLTVFDVVLLGRKPYISWRVSEKDKEIASQAIVSLGLEDLAQRYFNELSGGERQKVLLARALVQEPEVLLLDEPTANLDLRHQIEVMELITSLVRERKLSAIIALHDLNHALRFCDKLILLKKGEILAAGKPEEVITAENLREAYDVSVRIFSHEELGGAYVIPVSVA